MKVWKKMTAAAGLLAALAMGFVACETFQALSGGGTEGKQNERQGEGGDAIDQQEPDALNQEIALISSQADQLPDSTDKRRRLQQFRDRIEKYGWPSDTRYATEIRREVQALKDWVTAETAKQKAEVEQLAAANAKGVTEADFTVDVTQDGKGVIITGYKGMATAVKLPAAIQGMPVRVIRGFGGSSITSVVIPEGVTTIDEYAFSGCKQLAQVTLPSTLKVIEEGAFSGTALKAVVIPRGVTEIGGNRYYDGAFEGCTSLASVTIPNSVTSIDDSAFSGCTSLASVTIPNSVTRIGYSAFSGCTGLTSVTIPNSVTYIDERAFSGCTSLTTVTIPNSVTEIGNSAFSGCTSLASVTIPNSVTVINDSVFYGCTSLATVTISPVQGRHWRGGSTMFSGCSKISLASQAALRAAGYTGGF